MTTIKAFSSMIGIIRAHMNKLLALILNHLFGLVNPRYFFLSLYRFSSLKVKSFDFVDNFFNVFLNFGSHF